MRIHLWTNLNQSGALLSNQENTGKFLNLILFELLSPQFCNTYSECCTLVDSISDGMIIKITLYVTSVKSALSLTSGFRLNHQ